MSTAPHIVWLADLDIESEYFGRHSKQHARLTQAQFPLVPGFVITPNAYSDFLRANNLDHKIRQLLSTISFELPDSLMQAEFHIAQLFKQTKLPDDFIEELLNFYLQLGPEVFVQLYEIGSHGRKQHKKRLSTEDKLTDTILTCWAKMFSANALWHRHHAHHDHLQASCEIIISKKLSHDKKGRIFTINPQTHAKDQLVILMKKPHHGDQYFLSKRNLNILDRKIKPVQLGNKLTLEEIFAIAGMAKRLEEHLYFPQEITWILDANKLYVVNIKPHTDFTKPQSETKRKLPVARGNGITHIIGTGVTTIVHGSTDLARLNPHTILVLSTLHAKDMKKLKKIKGVVCENYPHAEAAVFLKHHGIPTICNVKHATKNFKSGQLITLNGAKGEIYLGGFL